MEHSLGPSRLCLGLLKKRFLRCLGAADGYEILGDLCEIKVGREEVR